MRPARPAAMRRLLPTRELLVTLWPMRPFTANSAKGAVVAAKKTLAHRWLPGIATAALLSLVAAAPAPAAAARHATAAQAGWLQDRDEQRCPGSGLHAV